LTGKRFRLILSLRLAKLTKTDKSSQYRKVKGSARQYKKIGGRKVISRRQFDNLRKREGVKGTSPVKATREAKISGLKKFWDRVEQYKEFTGDERSKRDIARSKTFKTASKNLKSKNTRAHGPLAEALEFFGYRDFDADYDVGDTPGSE
jgi:hypothetical protein